ncbi:hypothetical protein F3Y22_tig00110422pilonHSYRG00069 [Hibiscus syriacus]|uniref:Reverse transcriptase zinc-binding domain-containing protein n=1 Tax=Hibiscus syriacus TaxID=106335 RepID=A0A6A3AQN1_HIBSY|nr:hypothetical protein F3Y22_tig00110422pilonHSYRG00069 [Hibiscus syriacus]
MERTSVADMVDNNGEWRWAAFQSYLPFNVLLWVAAKKCPIESDTRDMVGWYLREDLNFSVKSAYPTRIKDYSGSKEPVWGLIHKYRGLSKIKYFLWLVGKGRIMNNAERVRRHFSSVSNCTCCMASIEDIDHVLRSCPLAFTIWVDVIKREKLNEFMTMDIKSWLMYNLGDPGYFVHAVEHWDIMFGAIVWNIWLNRNVIAFETPVDDCRSVMDKNLHLKEATCVALAMRSSVQVVHQGIRVRPKR